MNLYKLDSRGIAQAQVVAAPDFTRPVIMQLPDGIDVYFAPSKDPLKFTNACKKLLDIIGIAAAAWKFNIYTIRSEEFNVYDDISEYNESPNTYFSGPAARLVEQRLLAGLTDPSPAELKQRLSMITFTGFSYGSIIAGMVSNYLEHKMTNAGFSAEEKQEVKNSMFGVYAGSVVNFRKAPQNTPEVHSVYDADASYCKYTKHKPMQRNLIDGPIHDEMKGNRLVMTTFEATPRVLTAKLEITTGKNPVWKTESAIRDHHPNAYYNISRFYQGSNIKTFQVNHAAHVVAYALNIGANASLQSMANNIPRDGKSLVQKVRDTKLNETALQITRKRLTREDHAWRDLARAGQGSAPSK